MYGLGGSPHRVCCTHCQHPIVGTPVRCESFVNVVVFRKTGERKRKENSISHQSSAGTGSHGECLGDSSGVVSSLSGNNTQEIEKERGRKAGQGRRGDKSTVELWDETDGESKSSGLKSCCCDCRDGFRNRQVVSSLSER